MTDLCWLSSRASSWQNSLRRADLRFRLGLLEPFLSLSSTSRVLLHTREVAGSKPAAAIFRNLAVVATYRGGGRREIDGGPSG